MLEEGEGVKSRRGSRDMTYLTCCRQQKLAGVAIVEEPDGEPLENPFKPIKVWIYVHQSVILALYAQQAADETAAREKAVKARDEEIQEQLRNLSQTESTGETAVTGMHVVCLVLTQHCTMFCLHVFGVHL